MFCSSFLCSQIGWCICVEQKYEKVYYVLRFNILIRRTRWHKGVAGEGT
jgi:hypothetical protein